MEQVILIVGVTAKKSGVEKWYTNQYVTGQLDRLKKGEEIHCIFVHSANAGRLFAS
jgi:hypothetical protein